MNTVTSISKAQNKINRKPLLHTLQRYWGYYALVAPMLALLIVFRYLPMYGIIVAFKDYNIGLGIMGSKWAGLASFKLLLSDSEFYNVFANTLILSIYRLVFGFPVPIILALLLNEVRKDVFKRSVQTITYMPHFISWVIISGIFIDILSPNNGIVNNVVVALGGEPIYFMGSSKWIRGIIVGTAIFKEAGWSAIIYMAAIAGIDQEQYQAATVDGAGKLKQVWYITLPGIAPTIIVMLILRIGNIFDAGMEQVLMMYNPGVYDVVDIIDTFVYRKGVQDFQVSFTAAAGLFKNVIACILLLSTNALSNKLKGTSIY